MLQMDQMEAKRGQAQSQKVTNGWQVTMGCDGSPVLKKLQSTQEWLEMCPQPPGTQQGRHLLPPGFLRSASRFPKTK